MCYCSHKYHFPTKCRFSFGAECAHPPRKEWAQIWKIVDFLSNNLQYFEKEFGDQWFFFFDKSYNRQGCSVSKCYQLFMRKFNPHQHPLINILKCVSLQYTFKPWVYIQVISLQLNSLKDNWRMFITKQLFLAFIIILMVLIQWDIIWAIYEKRFICSAVTSHTASM